MSNLKRYSHHINKAENMIKIELPEKFGESSGEDRTPTSELTETSGSADESYLTASNTVADAVRFSSFDSAIDANNIYSNISIPIVGYEITEEKAKFTVFKLRIDNKTTGDSWFVFRRYTDFSRLHHQLKSEFPSIKLSLPRKKWFGDNFNSEFLDERVDGLQVFINSILKHKEVSESECVKSFFCLDEPPSYSDSIEESRAILEALEETIYHLRKQLKEKELEHEKLKIAHSLAIESKLRLLSFVQESTKECSMCAVRFSNMSVNEDKRQET